MNYHAIIPAAGIGQRMQSAVPKQYLKIQGRYIIDWSIQALSQLELIQSIWVALHPQDRHWSQTESAADPKVNPVIGGAERVHSVLNALNALSEVAAAQDWVLVHDAARPCLQAEDVQRLIQQAGQGCGGLLGMAVRDTMKRCRGQQVQHTVDRQELWHALTPQMFRLGELRSALQQALEQGLNITDESSAMEAAGYRPIMVVGRSDNIKITQPGDLELAQFYLGGER